MQVDFLSKKSKIGEKKNKTAPQYSVVDINDFWADAQQIPAVTTFLGAFYLNLPLFA